MPNLVIMLNLCFTVFSTRNVKNQGHADNENQSDGRTETIDPNIFKSSQSNATSSQSNVQYKTMKAQLVRCDAFAITIPRM